jgi:hypothetical protein
MTFGVKSALTQLNASCYVRKRSLLKEVATMIRRMNWLFLSLTLVSFGAFAQPPEEVPPPLPDSAGEIQAIPAAPAPEAPQVVAQPVAEPLAAPKPAAPPEDNRIKGISLTPGIAVYPFGYDSINLSPDNHENGRTFFGLKPMLGIATSFKTATDKTIDFGIDYAGLWREYYNKGTTRRDIENDIDGSLSIKWSDRISTVVTSSFAHFFKVGTDDGGDNALNVDTEPQLWIVANDQLKFKISYWVRFTDVFDVNVDWWKVDDMTNPPSDLDEFKRGIPFSDTTLTDNYSGDTAGQPWWMNYHGARTGVRYTPIKGTTLALDYMYVFAGLSNMDGQEWKAHFLFPKISQAMPWPGGTVSLSDEVRLRTYDYATVESGATKQNFRNRLTISVNQEINKYMTFEGFYRLELFGENKDDYNHITQNSWGFLGVSFAF